MVCKNSPNFQNFIIIYYRICFLCIRQTVKISNCFLWHTNTNIYIRWWGEKTSL